MTRAAIPRPPIPRLAGETLRYGMAMVVGLGVDLGLGYALNRWLAVPMLAAAAVGFLIAVAVNYLQFEYWVFATRQPGWARLGRAYGAAQGALLVRLAMVWLLGRLGLGRLPGDFRFRLFGREWFIPLASTVLPSSRMISSAAGSARSASKASV